MEPRFRSMMHRYIDKIQQAIDFEGSVAFSGP
jgi:hypothetical protein